MEGCQRGSSMAVVGGSGVVACQSETMTWMGGWLGRRKDPAWFHDAHLRYVYVFDRENRIEAAELADWYLMGGMGVEGVRCSRTRRCRRALDRALFDVPLPKFASRSASPITFPTHDTPLKSTRRDTH